MEWNEVCCLLSYYDSHIAAEVRGQLTTRNSCGACEGHIIGQNESKGLESPRCTWWDPHSGVAGSDEGLSITTPFSSMNGER
jgi:hypothetical protein